MINAAKQERDDCFEQIDDIQHALDNPVENNDDDTTYDRKQKHLYYLQTQEWNRFRDINTKISLLENTGQQTDPIIHHDTPPKPPKTHIRLGEDNQNEDTHRPANELSTVHHTLTRSQNPDSPTLAIPHHSNTPEVPKTDKIGNNQVYNLNY